MGFFSDIFDSVTDTDPLDLFGGKAREASERAAEVQAGLTREAIEENRRQFDTTTENLSPFLDAGIDALPGLSRGASLAGFGENIGDIFDSGALDPLVNERMRSVRNELGALGLRRSGHGLSAIADVPTELAFQLENLLNSRQQNIVGSGQNAAARLGAFGQNNAQHIGGLLQDQGNAVAQGIYNAQNTMNQNKSNLMQLGGTALKAFFSDSRLKTNIVKIGEHEGLNLYQWDWIPEAPDFIQEQLPVGFMADEVMKVRPDVVDRVAGFLTVAYDKLLEAA